MAERVATPEQIREMEQRHEYDEVRCAGWWAHDRTEITDEH